MKLQDILLEGKANERWLSEEELSQQQAKYAFAVSLDQSTGKGVVTMLSDVPANISDVMLRRLIAKVTNRPNDDWPANLDPDTFERALYVYFMEPDVRTLDKAIAYLNEYAPKDIRHGFCRIEVMTFVEWVQNTKEDWVHLNGQDDFEDDDQ